MERNGRGTTIGVVLVLLVSVMGFGLVNAQETDDGLNIKVNAEDEYVTIENTGETSYDLSGLTLSFDDGQTAFAFSDNETVAGGDSITVGTGTETEGETDYTAEYETHMLNDDDPDTVRLLDGDTVIASSADETDSDTGDSDDSEDSNDGDDSDSVDDGEDSDESNDDTDDSDDSDESENDTDELEDTDDTESDETTDDSEDDTGDETDDGDSSDETDEEADC
ncbi:hypothetical protein SAMN05421858_3913 [Haladaptatus litoreus]|uniref:LTD domain-containing protein n=1 Tax=Haladaptatus litoreus TaxID=553468 RepID=A0A1N7E0L7_9EURY|nr:lamin tail domain-containing protein [Haladaptatus litoreus]SIR81614.1 hypothetical protein SAMN05421858_3913 [Haladaptatus litoreus]